MRYVDNVREYFLLSRWPQYFHNIPTTSCSGGRHNISRPLQIDLWPFDLESGIRVTCDVGYLCANLCLPSHLCSRLRPEVRDRQTDRQTVPPSFPGFHSLRWYPIPTKFYK